LDPSRMARRFEDHFRASGMAAGWAVSGCAIEKVYYKPTRHCGVCYRVSFCSDSGGEADEWVYGRMFAPEIGHERFENAVAATERPRPAGDCLARVPALGFWEDLHMMVTVFPHDRKMPHLSHAVDPTYVGSEIEAHGSAMRGATNGSPAGPKRVACTELGYRRVKFMPGKRCVLHYRAQVAAAGESERELSFYSKTYNDSKSRYHFALLKSVCGQLKAQGAPIDIPAPLHHLDPLNTIWVADWKGAPLMAAIDREDFGSLLRRAAGMVATFHKSRIEGLRPGPDPTEALSVVSEDLARYGLGFPAHRDLAARIVERLVARKDAVDPGGAPVVPIHGACRVEQMLMRDGDVTLIDFDALALGDPIQDVAEFIASLEFLEITAGKPSEMLARGSRTFLEAYAEQVPWRCDQARIGWYVVAYLASKLYSVLKHLDFGALTRLGSNGEALADRWLEVVA